LHFANEVRSPSELSIFSDEIKQEELKMAKSLIDQMVIEFKPENYKDEFDIALKKLIELKLQNKEIVVPEENRGEEIPDLMEALRQSIKLKSSSQEGKKAVAMVK